ncbi:AraC family transcriptional regulator [Kiloniella majae]|uniref:AraC family transcriptional regulator n=1 Tax=Kiloniella majae TaxID=1938558 RepID=UPI000A2777D5|nr:AraC family transcriptional regulator [Kiloniella majae]
MVNPSQTIAKFTTKNILVLPQALDSFVEASCLMKDGNNAVYYKGLKEDLVNVEFYCNTPCFIYAEQGKERITSSDGNIVTINADTITFLPYGINLHSDYVRTSGQLKAFLIFLDENVVKDFFADQIIRNRNKQKNEVNFLNLKSNIAFKHYFQSLRLFNEQKLSSKGLLKSKLLEFLNLLALSNPEINLPSLIAQQRPRSAKRNVKRLLQNPEYLKLSISDLARLSGRSLSSFNRDFRASYNMPPKQWLKKQRLSYAEKLLRKQNQTITEIALDIGYENVSHFIKSYKESYGMTPKEYRRFIT